MDKLRVITPYGRPWAITESVLEQMCEAYDRHRAGEKFDAEGFQVIVSKYNAGVPVEAAVSVRSARDTGGQGYTVQDGVAIIDVDGIIAKGMNIFMMFCGGTSTELLQRDIAAAVSDPAVHSIIMRVDSPGGTVDGTQLAANAVKAASAQKRVVSWVTGCGCSAAYWIAAAAESVYLADSTTQVGSIGVVISHTDRSGADAKAGIKRTEITAGKYKRVASDTASLSDEGRTSLQGTADYLYSIFMPTMADWRGIDPQLMHDTAADGRTLIGQQAIDAGLADGIITLDGLVAQLNQQRQTKVGKTAASASGNTNTGEVAMYTQEQLDAAVATARDEALAQGQRDGAATELARVKGIDALNLPGHQEMIKALMLDGVTTPEQAAIKIVGAERAAIAQAGTNMHNEAPKPAPGAAIDPVAQPAAAQGAAAESSQVITAEQINAHVAKAKVEGRTISVLEAKQELAAAKK